MQATIKLTLSREEVKAIKASVKSISDLVSIIKPTGLTEENFDIKVNTNTKIKSLLQHMAFRLKLTDVIEYEFSLESSAIPAFLDVVSEVVKIATPIATLISAASKTDLLSGLHSKIKAYKEAVDPREVTNITLDDNDNIVSEEILDVVEGEAVIRDTENDSDASTDDSSSEANK